MPTNKTDPIGPEFQYLVLKRYTFWTLLIHENQSYLGRAMLWLHRPGRMQRFSALSRAELEEQTVALQDYEKALKKLWKPDHMNYAWLGNHVKMHASHGHMHIIPRYKGARKAVGRVFIDLRWGENYAPAPRRVSSRADIHKLVKVLTKELSK